MDFKNSKYIAWAFDLCLNKDPIAEAVINKEGEGFFFLFRPADRASVHDTTTSKSQLHLQMLIIIAKLQKWGGGGWVRGGGGGLG